MKLFDFSNVKGDLMGGITAAIISLPMGLAFGIQSGLGAEAGLYTAIILAFFAAFVGGTKTLISDPTGPMTVVAATVVSLGLVEHSNSITEAIPLIIATFLLAGLLQIAFGFLNIAQYIKYISYPVVSGFMGGIGVIIIALQIFPLMGHSSPKGVINIFSNIADPISNLNMEALLLGLGTIALIYLLPLISKKIPSILVALLSATIVSVLLDSNVPRVGQIPAGIPMPLFSELSQFKFSDFHLIFVPAITLASLGVIDTLLTSVVADNMTKTKHNGNKELVGQGIGNMLTALFGGFPGAGATMGTVINIRSGAKTNLSGMFKGLFLLIIVLALGGYVQYVPMSVLAGILFTIGAGIIDFKGIRLLLKVPQGDAIILLLTLFVTVFDTLLDAVALGAILSTMVFMKKMSDVVTDMEKEGDLEAFAKKSSISNLPDDLKNRIHVKSLDGPLFFGFADQFREYFKAIEDVYAVMIEMKKVPFMDETGLVTLEQCIKDLQERDIEVYIIGANTAIYQQFEKVGIPGNLIPVNNFFPYISYCAKHLKYKYKNEV